MNKVYLAETLAVCGVAAIATAWLGTASGLFVLVGLFGFFALAMPYLALALLGWCQRRLAITPIILLALSLRGRLRPVLPLQRLVLAQADQSEPVARSDHPRDRRAAMAGSRGSGLDPAGLPPQPAMVSVVIE
jgi:hypothetical protein